MVKAANGVILIACLALVCASGNAADEMPPDKPATNSETNAPSFQQPRTLSALLALPAEQLEKVDIARMNLLCAEGLRGSENLDVEECLRTLGAWTHHVERETKRNFHHFLKQPKTFNNSIPYYQLGMMGTVLAEDLRIQYNPERERQLLEKPINQQTIEDENAFFSSSADVFIHGLLTSKHYGTCASMPFLYAAVGRRLGYPVTIAARKYHLYLRYEGGNGEHLNMEATENRGFATPTDEEYRNGKYPMTQEEIDGCGWLRPLSNKEILGICLLNRANCLRSMKNYDMEITTLSDAARYLPDTVLMRRVIAKNQELARNLHAADRWDELWNELENLRFPTGGPMFEYFQNATLSVQLFMNQSTNLAEIEQSVNELKAGLRRYQAEISDDPAKNAEAYGRPQPIPANQRPFLALLQDSHLPTRLRIAQERVPHEYWETIPEPLQQRLSGSNDPEKIVGEMWAFQAEETAHRRARSESERQALYRQYGVRFGQEPQVNVPQHLLPQEYRDSMPLELKLRLAGKQGDPAIQSEIARYQLDVQNRETAQRAKELLRPTTAGSSHALNFQLVPGATLEGSPGQTLAKPPEPDSLLTPQLERQIKPATTGTGKP